MAETEQQATRPGAGLQKVGEHNILQQKRKSEDGAGEGSSPKKALLTDGGAKLMGKPGAGPIKMNLAANPAKPGLSMAIGKKITVAPIKMSLSTSNTKTKDSAAPAVVPKKPQVASVFGDSDSDEEEMPAEAKMRMRNVGRETPTAAGPNSFGKGNIGFCDRTKMIERELKQQMDEFLEKEDSKGPPKG